MLRKNVLLKQTIQNTSICSNSSLVSNIEDYETAYEDSDVFYSFSEDIDKNQTENQNNTTPQKNLSKSKSEISLKNTSTPISKKVLGMTLDNISFIDTETKEPTNQDPPVIQITNEFGETTGNKSESNAGEHTTVIMKENEASEAEINEKQKSLKEENQNFDIIQIDDSSKMEISDVIVINDSIPNKSQTAEPEKETVTTEPEIKPLDVITEKDETGEKCLEVVPEVNEDEADVSEEPEPEPEPKPEPTEVQNVIEEKTESEKPSLEPQSDGAKANADVVATPDIEVRDNFLKKYRETIQTHPFENEENDLAEGIALMSFPEDNALEARNPFTASKIRKPTRTLNLLPQNRRVTRRSVLPPAPVDEPKKTVYPSLANKRKSTVPPAIEEKPVAKRVRQSILPRAVEPKKPVEKSTNSNSNKTAIDRFQCKYCDRKFGVEKALHNHQEEYCTKIPDKDKRQLLVNNFKSNEKFLQPPPPPAQIRGRKSIVPPSSIVTRNQARMSIGQPVYSGITRTPSKTLTCTTCGSKFREVLDFANHVLVHRDERIAEEN